MRMSKEELDESIVIVQVQGAGGLKVPQIQEGDIAKRRQVGTDKFCGHWVEQLPSM